MDARAVLETVRDGSEPEEWGVLRMNQDFFLAQARSRFRLAIFAAAGWLILAVLFIAVDTRPGNPYIVLNLVSLVLWGALTITCVRAGFHFRRIVQQGAHEVFVLTPQGCVEGDLDSLRPIHEITYAETSRIARMQMKVLGLATGHTALRVELQNGSAWTWKLGDRFLPAPVLALCITVDFSFYTRREPAAFSDSAPA